MLLKCQRYLFPNSILYHVTSQSQTPSRPVFQSLVDLIFWLCASLLAGLLQVASSAEQLVLYRPRRMLPHSGHGRPLLDGKQASSKYSDGQAIGDKGHIGFRSGVAHSDIAGRGDESRMMGTLQHSSLVEEKSLQSEASQYAEEEGLLTMSDKDSGGMYESGPSHMNPQWSSTEQQQSKSDIIPLFPLHLPSPLSCAPCVPCLTLDLSLTSLPHC